MDRRHELTREECPDDLTDLVGGDDAGDSQPVGELGGDRGLADSRDPADQDDQRPVESSQQPPLAKAPGDVLTLLLGEHLLGQPSKLADVHLASPATEQPLLDQPGEREATFWRKAGGHDRLRHQALRIGQSVVATHHHDFPASLRHLPSTPTAWPQARGWRRGPPARAARAPRPGSAPPAGRPDGFEGTRAPYHSSRHWSPPARLQRP